MEVGGGGEKSLLEHKNITKPHSQYQLNHSFMLIWIENIKNILHIDFFKKNSKYVKMLLISKINIGYTSGYVSWYNSHWYIPLNPGVHSADLYKGSTQALKNDSESTLD